MIEERVDGDVVLYFVDDRKAATLEPLLQQHILPGSTVHTDGWGAYEAISWNALGFNRVKHIHAG